MKAGKVDVMARDSLILEGLVTTVRPDGHFHVAPMGPRCDAAMRQLLLRPFSTSHTLQHLLAAREGVFHVVDDVLLLARAAIGRLDAGVRTMMAKEVRGHILLDACRYYEFKVDQVDQSGERAELHAQVVGQGRLRDFFGLNRAKFAVVEAAILATRVHLLERCTIEQQLDQLEPLVDKTGGSREREAWQLLREYIREHPLAPAPRQEKQGP